MLELSFFRFNQPWVRRRRTPAGACAALALAATLGGCAASTPAPERPAPPPATEADQPANTTPEAGHPSSAATARSAPSRPEELAELERSLAERATLDGILRVALARNPDLAEARARARAARESAPARSRLPDPELEYQLWAAPLARPYALDEAQMHMVGLRQTFPAPGSLGAQSEAAAAEAEVAREIGRAREQDLVARVRRAYAEYHRAEREYQIHVEHGALVHQVLEVTRAAYRGGRGTQQDVLRADVEMSRLHSTVANAEGDRRTARALLNTLMARRTDAPLGPPAALDALSLEVRATELEHEIGRRPEIVAAESAIRARRHELDAARSSGRWPAFMVGVQYMYMPPMEHPHNYGVMLSMSLPWLNPRYGEEVRAAEARIAAEQSALSSSRNAARFELYAAVERLKAARASFAIIDRDVLPRAEQSFATARAVYRGGQGDSLALFDALGSLLDVRIERERARQRVESALADVERAVGHPIPASGAKGARTR